MGAWAAAAADTRVSDASRSLEQAHAELLKDRRLQFELSELKPPERPAWLDWIEGFFELLRALAPLLKFVFWGGVAVVVAVIVFFIVREIAAAHFNWKPKGRRTAVRVADWRPDTARARVLLEDADRLAAEGRYAEAAHLLLLRGVADIQDRRPRAVQPALTSRDIAASPDLPPPARPAFTAIAEVVERSLFGGRPVDQPAWTQCRRAYESLVFADTWA